MAELPTWNALIDGKINSEIVVYGSSRAWVHINPAIISRILIKTSYNLGMDGHPFPLQYFRHRLLMQRNQKPKLIIQCLDTNSLTKLEDLYNHKQFLPYILWNQEFMDATANYNGFKYLDYKIPLIRYYGAREILKEINKIKQNPKSDTPRRIRGYQGQQTIWNGDFEKAQKKSRNITIQLNESTIASFESYLRECQSKKIKVLLVYSPEYIKGQNFIKNRKQVIDLYKKLASKYSIPFYDYSNEPISKQRKNFYNVTHLNKEAAENFTEQLALRIKKDPNFSTIFK